MILIGSSAFNFYRDQPVKVNDIDYVGTYDEINQFRKSLSLKAFYPINGGDAMFMLTQDKIIIEADIAWENSRADKLIKFIHTQNDNNNKDGHIIPSLDVLYLLKMSHRYKKDSPHFKKTLDDILEMRKMGAKIRPEHVPFLKERESLTYTNKLPKLNQSKDGFFGADTGVEYTYDHDSIHEAVKLYDTPAYYKFIDGQVWCSKAKWDKCSKEIQLAAAYEEICVLSLERSIVPYPGAMSYREVFNLAHMKLASSISSGWFREFCWENYYDIQGMYSDEFVDKFKIGLENGVVLPHDPNKKMY
jgi:hypothetical protein